MICRMSAANGFHLDLCLEGYTFDEKSPEITFPSLSLRPIAITSRTFLLLLLEIRCSSDEDFSSGTIHNDDLDVGMDGGVLLSLLLMLLGCCAIGIFFLSKVPTFFMIFCCGREEKFRDQKSRAKVVLLIKRTRKSTKVRTFF